MNKRRSITPPKLAERLFRFYCRNGLGESILGDLEERFFDDLKASGVFRARMNYYFNVIRFINRYTLRKESKSANYNSNHFAMLKNYLIVTIRNLWNHKSFATINIFGLAVGLASCLIIFLYVKKEVGFDRFHTNSKNLYRVTNTFERSTSTTHWARTPPVLAPAIRDNFAAVEKATRLRYADDHLYTIDDRSFYQGNAFYADSLFLEMFDFNLISGNRNTALDDPGSIVITEAMANKFFGRQDPMGQLVTFDNERTLKVTGILAPIPTDSHITFDMLISFPTFVVPAGYTANLNSWGWAGFWTYMQLTDNANYKVLEGQITALYRENFRDRPDLKTSITVQPLSDIYLESSHYSNVGESIRIGDKTTILGLTVIAIMILVVAGFNFMNLSTAMSLKRGKEIGIRKVMGAVKFRIISQFLTESVVIGMISLVLAIIMVLLSKTYFESQLGVELPDTVIDYLKLLPFLLLATTIIGVLAGVYPSFVLSAFNPILALRGNLSSATSGAWLRKGLMIFQFAISIGLIAASVIVYDQMEFIRNKSLGFDKDNVLKVRMGRDEMLQFYEPLRNKFLQNSKVRQLARVSHALDGSASSGPAWLKGTDREDAHQMAFYQTDHDFLDVTGIRLLEGRYFSKEFPNDTSVALILNQSAVDEFGLTNPVGQQINMNNRERTVVGIIEDFHYSSLHTPIAPLAIVMPFVNPELMLIKISGGDLKTTLQSLEEDWRSVVGNLPFEVTFLEDNIQRMYEKEAKLSSLITVFSALAVLLACLGLYGLVAFSVNNKLKEVGIRKVLGASLNNLLLLLSKQFILLIVLANVVAWPLTWLAADEWLTGFAYRVNIGMGAFVLSAVMLLLIAILTISHQTIKAALTNPVKVLRNE